MIQRIQFPNPRWAGDDGIVGLGGELHWENLAEAYRQGIFPWPIEGWPLPWFCPARRAILEFRNLRIGRTLRRARERSKLGFTLDEAFDQVIRKCAAVPRPEQDGTWITDEMIEAYCDLHRHGLAHSVEAWSGDELVGGLYGVDAGGAFAGESMFYERPDASKLALLFLVDHLASRGLDWMDIQTMTPHMRALGARLVARRTFLNRLKATQERGLELFDRRTGDVGS
jgi:leucyl/phenylalanyl-tRNA--protein transferase